MFVWWKENGRIDDEINWNKETFGNSIGRKYLNM